MRKTIFKGLTGLLLPFAAYAAAPAGYGAYQRRQPVSAVSHQTLSDAVRPYAWPAASAPRVLDENELAIASGTPAKELVIIDAAVPDKHILYRAAKPGLEIVEIAATEPGLSQLTDILARYKNLSALHIVSHAADGELLLGNSRITAEDIKQEVGAFSALNGALREGGDLLLYGCDLAAGDAGSELLGIIQSNTHLDVAASSNKTGSRDLKGDWELEISTGDIEAELPFSDKALKDFSAVLAAPNGTYGFQTGWTGGGTSTLTSTHFLVSARDSNTSDPANVDIYNAPPYPAYIKNGIDSANNYFYVRADGVNTGSFELTALTSGEYATGQFTNVRIVGIKLDNTQVTSSTINGNSGSSEENFNFGAGQLASFSGVQIKAFKLYFDTTSAVPSTVPFFEFRTFTIANAQNPNSPPAIANLNGDSVAWAGVGNTVSLDAGGNATVSDVDLDALNGGNGNYSGASLTVQRNGGAVTSDTFGFNTSGALFTVSGSNLQSGGQTFATFTNSNGVLTISFTSSGTTATTALVNDVLRRITYRNDTPAGDATVRFTLSDGTASTTADVTVTTDNIYITNTTDTATIDRTNGVSFSEAIAIAAADGTGTQTLIFASTLAGQTVSATSATSLSESLTLDMDSASGMTLSGGTLSLGGGVTLTLTNGSSDTVSIGTVFAGTGTLSKTGAGTVTLTGSQTYSGTTTISGGTLSVAGDGNLGGGQVVLNGATLAVTGSTTIDNAIALSGAGTIDNGSNITLSGLLSGSNTLTKTGSGTLTLTNTGNSGSYSGGITVSAGRLAGAADSVFTSGALTLNGGSLNNNNTAFTLDNPIVVGAGGGNVFVANAGFTLSGVISGSGALTKTGGQNLTLSGNNTFSGGLAVSGASGLTIANGSNLGSGTVTLNSGIFTITGSGITISNNISMSGDATISNANAVTLSGVISNTGAITKTGAGTLTLSGTNTNTGALSLSAGALTITGTVAGAITAESGTTLQGTGSISGLVTVNSGGTLQIGGSPGTMSLGGGLTLNSGGTLIARINGTTAGTQYDQYNVTGAVTLGGTLSTTGTYTPVIPNSFVIINNDGSDAISGTFNGLAEGGAVTVNAASMRITYLGNTGNDAVLIFPTPVVTDANISISGATGIGGAYKIGDTVTATWNNTAGGDNNAGVTGVTVDFTQFGGGAAVAATESSGTWTATYTIVAGSIDLTNRNVSVTATNASGPTTTADTTNATVDNIAPTVTDARISISGASGTGGAFKIGDTVTAAWNNTAGGDNNSDTISGVTVNFTAFGGGAAVAASNSSGTWTATFTIVSGAIDATNRNVSVTATDNAGNATTTADTTNATVDNVAPTVTDANISISGASGAGGAYRVGDTVTTTWNNTAGGDNNSDTISSVTVNFTQFGGGAAVAATNSSGTWTATYTIVSGAIDATNRNVSVTATDNAGNATTTADTTNATVDNVGPTVTDANISISGASGTGGAFKTGDTVTATWNNTAGGDNNSDTISSVTVNFTAFGGGAAVAASNSSGTWTATYIIVSGAIDATNRNVSVTATDNAGNATTTADTTNATVDSVAPTVTDGNISISGATGTGGAYKIGDTVTATWNNTAGGDNNSDTISSVTADFTQFGGGAAVAASNSSGTWTATYTIVSGAIDATNRNVSVTATDNAGNATTTADTSNATVDNIAPTVTDANILISGASGTGGAYKTGDTVTATWNNTAGGDNNSDTISGVTVDFSQFGGGAAVAASNSSGTWTATYTIVSGAIDATNRNVSVTATDNAGNATTTADTSNATVDNQAPTVGSVGLPANGTYITGQNLDFTVNYSEAVTIDTTGGTPGLALTIGATVRSADYVSGSGTTALVFRYTVQAGDIDGDGIALNSALQTNGGTLRDSVGNDASSSLGTIGSLASVLVDAQVPDVNSVSLPANGTYIVGQNLDFTVNYDEAVTVNTGGGTPRLALTIGLTARFANYLSGSGTTALVFRYTVQAGDNDGDGIALNAALQTNGGTIRDTAGNDAATALGTIGSLASVLVDTVAPAVDSVSLPADETYLAGENIDFTVNYDEAVIVDTAGGTPRLALTIGSSARFANYLSGSGSTALLFRHTVQAGDVDSDGIALSGTLQANGGTLRDAAGNDAATALGAIGSLAGVLVDAEAPVVTSVALPANGTYGAGDNLDFTVNYDEAVTVNTGLGTPRLALTIGSSARFASYIGGSGTTALLFRHTVQAGDTDSDGIVLNDTLQTNGGALRDSSGNDAATDLGVIGSLAGVLVDARSPAISSVNLPADGTYTAGQNLDFTVNYDESVIVNTAGGTPRLALTVGSTARFASYISGSGTAALVFRYTAQAGDNDNDGIALNSTLQANGATLRDAADNDAASALGATGSLAAVLVDTQPPAIDINTGLNVVEGGSAVISSVRLAASDNVSAAAGITFTVITVPANGELSLNAAALGVNDTFTQDDIDNDRLSYQHDGSQTASDSFGFSVRDAVNNPAAGGTFSITVAPPEQPVVNAPADLDIDATGLFTTVTLRQLLGLAPDAGDAAVQAARLALASDAADGADCCNPVAVELTNGMIRLAPGEHFITWRATDSDSNTAEDVQTVYVHPLVSLGKDQTGVEGGQVALRFILNGPTPVQLDVPYAIDTAQSSADGADHDLVDGIASFNAGETEVSITVNLVADAPEGDEVLVVNLNEALVNAGANRSQRITITEGNLPPTVTLSLEQNGVVTSLVTPAGGVVTVNATAADPNGDTLTYDWSMSDAALIDTDGDDATFTFDPSSLNEGVLRLHVAVGDGTATATATRYFRVVTALPNMGVDAGDSDGDGIPDYLDDIAASNVLPETAAQTDGYLVECDPGVRCGLGRHALLGTGGGARLAPADLSAQGIAADAGYEHVGGVFDFEARGLPVAGQSLRVAIPLQAAIPMGAVYRKYQDSQWNSFVEDDANALHSAPGEAGYCPPPGDASWQAGLQAGSYCLQLTLEDGGPNDADGAADGSIEDPGSIAVQETDEEVTVYGIRSKVKGGSGSTDIALLGLLAVLLLLRGRRMRKPLAGGLLLILLPAQSAQALDWKALAADSYLEFGFFQAKGSRGEGELLSGLADAGVAADVQTYDVTRPAWQLYAGWQYRERLSVRFGYLDLGDAEVGMTAAAVSDDALVDAIADSYPVSADGWVLSHRFEYYTQGSFSLALDAGLYFWNSEIALTDLNGRDIVARDADGTDPVAGIGGHYRFSERYTASLGWQRVFFDNQDVALWGLSGVFRF